MGVLFGIFKCSICILGCGDYKLNNISALPDPCGLPGDRASKTKQARRVLNEKERLLYAPFSGVGGIVYDKDAVYIELGGSHSHRPTNSNEKVKLKKNFLCFISQLKF
jgi:ribosome biogenesis protein BMS1